MLHAGTWTEGLPLVHRDVKPANLVEDRTGDIVLVDPSTLRGLDATHLTRVGTPVFSAPEVMTGRFGPPADVYSFAATVVALLTGARGERLAAFLDEAHLLDLPEGVAFALSPVPGDRPESCRAVLEAGTVLADDRTLLDAPGLFDVETFPDWHEDATQDPDWYGGDHAVQSQGEYPRPLKAPHLWPWEARGKLARANIGRNPPAIRRARLVSRARRQRNPREHAWSIQQGLRAPRSCADGL